MTRTLLAVAIALAFADALGTTPPPSAEPEAVAGGTR